MNLTEKKIEFVGKKIKTNKDYCVLRPRTHGVKKVPESLKFESNLTQNPLF